MEEHVVAQSRACRGVATADLNGRLVAGVEVLRFNLDGKAALRVAAEVAAHTGQVGVYR